MKIFSPLILGVISTGILGAADSPPTTSAQLGQWVLGIGGWVVTLIVMYMGLRENRNRLAESRKREDANRTDQQREADATLKDGMIESLNEKVGALMQEKLDDKFRSIEHRFNEGKDNFEKVGKAIERVEERLNGMDRKLAATRTKTPGAKRR